MKKLVSLFLALTLALSLASAAFATSEEANVVPSSQRLTVNGIEKTTEIYNIDGANFFKLRDMAALLNGTNSQFNVEFNGTTNTIELKTKTPYTSANGYELQTGVDNSKSAVKSSQSLEIDGVRVDLTAFNIGGTNFFKLRDLGEKLNFGVDYDAESATMIVTSADAQPTERQANQNTTAQTVSLEALQGVWFNSESNAEREYIISGNNITHAEYYTNGACSYYTGVISGIDRITGGVWCNVEIEELYNIGISGYHKYTSSFKREFFIKDFTSNSFNFVYSNFNLHYNKQDQSTVVGKAKDALAKAANEATSGVLTTNDKNNIRQYIQLASTSDSGGLKLLLAAMTYDLGSMTASTARERAKQAELAKESLDSIKASSQMSKTAMEKIISVCQNKSGTDKIISNANEAILLHNEIISIPEVNYNNLERCTNNYTKLVELYTGISDAINK